MKHARHIPYAILVAGAAAALGQSDGAPRDLERLRDDLASRVPSAEEARTAADSLDSWRLDAQKLPPEQQAGLIEVKLRIALALGDAAQAAELAPQLRAVQPDAPRTWEAAYLAACAAGDAPLALEALGALEKSADSAQRRRFSLRKRWAREIGQDAPNVTLRAEDQTALSAEDRRGKALVIDFWNVLTDQDEQHAAALKRLHEAYGAAPELEWVGVNSDSESRLERAKAWATEHGYAWKQCYERPAGRAPITHEQFHVTAQPWLTLIDGYSFVRAVGAANEPGFEYALRAAVAEARGDFPAVTPTTRDGHKPGGAPPAAESEEKVVRPPTDLPSDPEAARLLGQGRLFWRTGKKTDARKIFEEIVAKYPGTREAEAAKVYLDP